MFYYATSSKVNSIPPTYFAKILYIQQNKAVKMNPIIAYRNGAANENITIDPLPSFPRDGIKRNGTNITAITPYKTARTLLV